MLCILLKRDMDLHQGENIILIYSKRLLTFNCLQAYRDRFSQWEFTKRQVSLHKDVELIAKV